MESPPPAPVRPGTSLLAGTVRAGSGWTVALVGSTTVSAVAALLLPATLAAAVDAQFGRAGSGAATARVALVLAVLLLAGMATELAAPSCVATAGRALRHRLVRHTLAAGLPGHRRFATGDVVSRLTSATTELAGGAAAITQALASLLTAAAALVALAIVDLRLALVFLVAVPGGFAMATRFVSGTTDIAVRYMAGYGAIAARLVDALAGVRTIQASGTVGAEIARVLVPRADLSTAGRQMWSLQARVGWQAGLLMPAVQLAVLAVAGHGVVNGRLTPGQLLAATAYTGLAMGLLDQASVLMLLGRARAAARRLAEVLALPVPPARSGSLPAGPGELVLRSVTVAGDTRPVLDRLDLVVPAGRSVAVVGTSSAGKSTLAAVAGRLIDPDEGQVLLDGVSLADVDAVALSREVRYAFERPALLGGTVAAAIALGADDAPLSAVESAARTAQADRFVRLLPGGYDNPLAATPLSGGEAQRLGLARALVRRARLLILDDTASSLDTVTERQVSSALTRTLPGCTRLVVAHRLGTVLGCDLVLWLDRGRVRAFAPPDALWNDAEYRALFDAASAVEPEVRCPAVPV